MFNTLQESMNARGLYWFKLEMSKLVDVTGSCQTHRQHTWYKVLQSWKRAQEKPHTFLLSSSPSALGYSSFAHHLHHSSLTIGRGLLGLGSCWPRAPLTWPGLPCLHLGRALFLLRIAQFPVASSSRMVSQLLLSHPPPQWWTHPGCSGCIYFQSKPKEQFPNRSIHFVFLLSPFFLDKRAGNSWGAAGIPTPLKVCHKCLDSQNEPIWKGNTPRSPACTAPGDWAHRSEMERHF